MRYCKVCGSGDLCVLRGLWFRCAFCGSDSCDTSGEHSTYEAGSIKNPEIILPWVEAYDGPGRRLLNLTADSIPLSEWKETQKSPATLWAKVPSGQYNSVVCGNALQHTRHWRQLLVEIVKSAECYALISLEMDRPVAGRPPEHGSQVFSPIAIRDLTASHGLEICDCRFLPSSQLWLFRKVDPCAGF